MELSTNIKYILGVIIMLTVLGGTLFSVDSRYAKADSITIVKDDIKKVESRLDYKILNDKADRLQERIWKYEDRYEDRTMPDDTKELVRDLQRDLDELENVLKTIGE